MEFLESRSRILDVSRAGEERTKKDVCLLGSCWLSFLNLFCCLLCQVKVKVVTKVNVEDVELSVVDKEQNIKSKTLR